MDRHDSLTLHQFSRTVASLTAPGPDAATALDAGALHRGIGPCGSQV
jgi:hypothetical protein